MVGGVQENVRLKVHSQLRRQKYQRYRHTIQKKDVRTVQPNRNSKRNPLRLAPTQRRPRPLPQFALDAPLRRYLPRLLEARFLYLGDPRRAEDRGEKIGFGSRFGAEFVCVEGGEVGDEVFGRAWQHGGPLRDVEDVCAVCRDACSVGIS